MAESPNSSNFDPSGQLGSPTNGWLMNNNSSFASADLATSSATNDTRHPLLPATSAAESNSLSSLLLDYAISSTSAMLQAVNVTAAATTTTASLSNNHSDSNWANSTLAAEMAAMAEVDADEEHSEYVFDRTYVRVIFVTFYATVFFGCLFGNLMVIMVVSMSRRLHSTTNFFLANLAVADLCVGIFCVLQNLSVYLITSWVFGEFLCKMYQYVQTLSYIASIFILILICVERYCAIIHPLVCKQILTSNKLRIVMALVWSAAALCSFPKFYYSREIANVHENGNVEYICIMHRGLVDTRTLDYIQMGLLYVLPLSVMLILYTRIAWCLWNSNIPSSVPLKPKSTWCCLQRRSNDSFNGGGHGSGHGGQPSAGNGCLKYAATGNGNGNSACGSNNNGSGQQEHLIRSCSRYDKRNAVAVTESQVSVEADKVVVTTTWRPKRQPQLQMQHLQLQPAGRNGSGRQQGLGAATPPAISCRCHKVCRDAQKQLVSKSSAGSRKQMSNVLKARRGVVKMLMVFVFSFAIFNLPLHARKFYQYWSTSYQGSSDFNAIFTPLTFLSAYFNSALNPLLYAFLSRNFRKGMREVLRSICCKFCFATKKSRSMQSRQAHQQQQHVSTRSEF